MGLLRRRPEAPSPRVQDTHRAALDAISAAHRLHVPRPAGPPPVPVPPRFRDAPAAPPPPPAPPPRPALLAPERPRVEPRAEPRVQPQEAEPPREQPVDTVEATSLACAFALDLTSWDEENPDRRALVLARYLPDVVDVERLGWDGRGRQRSETVIPGAVNRDDATHLRVDVRVRVTPFVRLPGVVPLHPVPEHEPTGGAVLSAAPAPVAPGWVACDSEWVRLSVPIARRRSGGLVVDLGAAHGEERGAC